MNASIIKSAAKKVLAVLVVAVLASGIAFASTLSPVGEIKDAKVYAPSNKLSQNVSEVSDGWTIRTITSDVAFANENISLEIGSNSLLQVISLADKAVEIYLLDGNVIATTYNTDVVLRTTVTSYNVKAGSTVFVVSDEMNETAYIEVGTVTADNLITNATTEIPEGTYIDNSVCNFQPEETTKEDFSKTARPQAQPVQVQEEVVIEIQPAEEMQPEASQPQFTEDGALVKTLEYYSFTATIKAYTGMAYVQYPAFVTDQELETAAAAAFWKYADLLDGVYFYIQDDGLAVVTYPDYYGPAEFSYAMELLEVELPAYLNELFGIVDQPAEKQTADVVEAEPETVETEETIVVEAEVMAEPDVQPVAEEEAPAEQPAEEEFVPVELPAEETQTTTPETLKTPLETVTKEQAEASAKKAKKFRFGAEASVVYGAYRTDAQYTAFEGVNNLIGIDTTSVRIILDPYFRAGNFTLGLHLSVDPLDLKDSFGVITDKGVLGYASTAMSYVSKISYSSDAFSFNVDRKQDIEFSSPVFRTLTRAFDGSDDLSATVSAKAGVFNLYAFADDLEFSDMLENRKQLFGARAAFSFKAFELGASAIADMAQDVADADIYSAVDLSIPLTIRKTDFRLSAAAALQIHPNDISNMESLMAKGTLDVTRGAVTFGVGAAYSMGDHNVDIVSNAPVQIDSKYNGKALDVLLSAAVNTKHFDFDAAVNVPFSAEERPRLIYNTATIDGTPEQLSADVLTAQAKLKLGKFSLSAGMIYNGLVGRVFDSIGDIIGGASFGSAVRNVLDPNICNYYAIADFKAGFVDVYAKADYKSVNGSLTMPLSVGMTLSF